MKWEIFESIGLFVYGLGRHRFAAFSVSLISTFSSELKVVHTAHSSLVMHLSQLCVYGPDTPVCPMTCKIEYEPRDSITPTLYSWVNLT